MTSLSSRATSIIFDVSPRSGAKLGASLHARETECPRPHPRRRPGRAAGTPPLQQGAVADRLPGDPSRAGSQGGGALSAGTVSDGRGTAGLFWGPLVGSGRPPPFLGRGGRGRGGRPPLPPPQPPRARGAP